MCADTANKKPRQLCLGVSSNLSWHTGDRLDFTTPSQTLLTFKSQQFNTKWLRNKQRAHHQWFLMFSPAIPPIKCNPALEHLWWKVRVSEQGTDLMCCWRLGVTVSASAYVTWPSSSCYLRLCTVSAGPFWPLLTQNQKRKSKFTVMLAHSGWFSSTMTDTVFLVSTPKFPSPS